MKKRLSYLLYRLIRWLIWLFYPKIEVVGTQNLPQEPVIIAANHCKMNGPIACELYFPGSRYTWCAGQMMHRKDVPEYAFQDFWSGKPKHLHWFYRLLSYIITPVSVCVFNNARTIGVYHDTRILSTFKNTVNKLMDGANVVIFPEHLKPHNHIVWDFQDRFIDVARLYYKKTGKALSFVPMYIAPSLKKMYLGQPVTFCPEKPIEEERQRICAYLMEQITQIAVSLPEHTVVPYANVPRRDYPSNHTKEAVYEKS